MDGPHYAADVRTLVTDKTQDSPDDGGRRQTTLRIQEQGHHSTKEQCFLDTDPSTNFFLEKLLYIITTQLTALLPAYSIVRLALPSYP